MVCNALTLQQSLLIPALLPMLRSCYGSVDTWHKRKHKYERRLKEDLVSYAPVQPQQP